LTDPTTASALAKLAIMTELVICAALWIRPTRAVAVWCGVWFHIAMAWVSEDVATAVVGITMYGVFATPDHGARKLRFDRTRFRGRFVGTVVPFFDWLGRFEVSSWEPDDQRGHSMVVERRDGERVTGVRALAMVARAIPVLFPLWAPLALVASFTRHGDLTASS
jgi:hypothetical protein